MYLNTKIGNRSFLQNLAQKESIFSPLMRKKVFGVRILRKMMDCYLEMKVREPQTMFTNGLIVDYVYPSKMIAWDHWISQYQLELRAMKQ